MLKFHNQWYSANIMALAVLGKGFTFITSFLQNLLYFYFTESIDELEEMAVRCFANVVNKAVDAPIWEEHPFKLEQLRTCAYIVPLKDVRNLNIIFPSPDLQKYYKSVVCIHSI